MKHIKLFESFINESTYGMIFRFNQNELNKYEKDGGYCITFYPARPGGTSFTIAKDQDVILMRELLNKNGVSANVGFGPYYHNAGGRDPKSMVVILNNDEKEKKIVYDIIDRNFSLNYPIHQLG